MNDRNTDFIHSSETEDKARMARAEENGIEADRLIDVHGRAIPVPPDKKPINAAHGEPSVGGTGPTNWWRTGLVLMAILILLLIGLQWFTGGSMTPTGAIDGTGQ